MSDERERDTFTPEAGELDVMISMAEKLDMVATSLASVAQNLASIGRDLGVVRSTQKSHGTEIEQNKLILNNALGRIEAIESYLRSIGWDG